MSTIKAFVFAGLVAGFLATSAVAESLETVQGSFQSVPLAMIPPSRELLSRADCAQSDNLEKALRACMTIIRRSTLDNEKLAAYWNRRAEIHYMQGNYDDAISDLETAISLDRSNKVYTDNLAFVRRKAGR